MCCLYVMTHTNRHTHSYLHTYQPLAQIPLAVMTSTTHIQVKYVSCWTLANNLLLQWWRHNSLHWWVRGLTLSLCSPSHSRLALNHNSALSTIPAETFAGLTSLRYYRVGFVLLIIHVVWNTYRHPHNDWHYQHTRTNPSFSDDNYMVYVIMHGAWSNACCILNCNSPSLPLTGNFC